MAAFRASLGRSKSPADTDIGKENGGLHAQSPAEAEADFQVRRDQIVHAGTEVILTEVARTVLREETEVFGMDLEALAERHTQNRGGCPHLEAVAVFAVGGKAHGGIEPPAVGQSPAKGAGCYQLRGSRCAAGRRLTLQDGDAIGQPGLLLGQRGFQAIEHPLLSRPMGCIHTFRGLPRFPGNNAAARSRFIVPAQTKFHTFEQTIADEQLREAVGIGNAAIVDERI